MQASFQVSLEFVGQTCWAPNWAGWCGEGVGQSLDAAVDRPVPDKVLESCPGCLQLTGAAEMPTKKGGVSKAAPAGREPSQTLTHLHSLLPTALGGERNCPELVKRGLRELERLSNSIFLVPTAAAGLQQCPAGLLSCLCCTKHISVPSTRARKAQGEPSRAADAAEAQTPLPSSGPRSPERA